MNHARGLPLSMALAVVLAVSGCGLEAPEAPRFSTTLNVPLGEETYTGLDMADDLEAIEGDSLSAGPLTIEAGEELAAVYLEEALRCTLAAQRVSASLAEIDFTLPAIDPCTFELGMLLPGIPPEGIPLPADPFLFEPPAVDLGVFSEFEVVEITSGRLEVELTNRLPVPVGGPAGGAGALEVALIDLSATPPRVVVELALDGEVAPQETAFTGVELAGVVVGNHLAAEIRGGSPGSGGAAVTWSAEDGLDLAFAFSGCRIGRFTGIPPELAVTHAGEVVLDERFRITAAELAGGSFEWRLASDLPLAAHATLSFPTVRRDGEPLVLQAQLPAEGEVRVAVPLAGLRITAEQASSLPWELTVESLAGGQPCTVELGDAIVAECAASEIRFDSIRGVLSEIVIPVPTTEAQIEFPEEIDGVRFAAAEMRLRVRNPTPLALQAELLLTGAAAGAETLTVPFSATIAGAGPAGPAETTVVLDEANSRIVDLLNLRPERVWVAGQLLVGDGNREIEVSAADFVDGSFAVTVPMRLMLAEAHHQGEAFDIEIDTEGRDQIAEHLEAAAVATRIRNHFPAGVRVQLHFARSAGALFVDDELVIDLGTVAAAPVDPATGRVSAPIDQTVDVYLGRDQVDLFALPELYGAVEVTLAGDGDEAVEIWTTDYATVTGMAALEYRVE